jgi:hypothetical protein
VKLITFFLNQRHGLIPETHESVCGEGPSGSTPSVIAPDMGQTRLLLPDPRAGTTTSIDPATAAAAVGGWGCSMQQPIDWNSSLRQISADDVISATTGTQGKFPLSKGLCRVFVEPRSWNIFLCPALKE